MIGSMGLPLWVQTGVPQKCNRQHTRDAQTVYDWLLAKATLTILPVMP